ncbi:MAG TPA: hypothetical protein VEX36_02460 [Thermoleophilaceae bacterium]|nr:hypothetical protein [Thermoleophilaceae bacterium]
MDTDPDQNHTTHSGRLRAFLEREGMNHDWWVRMLLKYGRAFEWSSLPKDVLAMQERCCYLNSFTLATEQPDRFVYFEGYAALASANGWGSSHAWCIDGDGKVVDPTWANIRSAHPGGYLGMPIPLHIVEPYAYFESRGTIDGWLRERRDEMEIELPRQLGVDPI